MLGYYFPSIQFDYYSNFRSLKENLFNMGFSFEYILVLIIALVLIFDFVSKKTNDKLINSEDRIGKKVKENKPSLKYFTKRPRIIILFIAAISLSVLSINLINAKSSVKGILSKKIIAKLPVSCIGLSPNKNLIAVADDTNDPLGFNKLDEVFNITIFNSSNYRKIYELSGHNESIESINLALENYPGTLFFVSHDREFVSSLATRIFEITPHGINDFRGTYDEFLAAKEAAKK